MTTQTHSWWKTAVVLVIAINAIGFLAGQVSGSGYGNAWFDALQRPSFMPPGWAFGAAWTTLYTMLGLALATVLNEPRSHHRRAALTGPLDDSGPDRWWIATTVIPPATGLGYGVGTGVVAPVAVTREMVLVLLVVVPAVVASEERLPLAPIRFCAIRLSLRRCPFLEERCTW